MVPATTAHRLGVRIRRTGRHLSLCALPSPFLLSPRVAQMALNTTITAQSDEVVCDEPDVAIEAETKAPEEKLAARKARKAAHARQARLRNKDWVQLLEQEVQSLKERAAELERALASQVRDALRAVPPPERRAVVEGWLDGVKDTEEEDDEEDGKVGVPPSTDHSTMLAIDLETAPKSVLPPLKRLTKGLRDIEDPTKPQAGDVIVVFFDGKWQTGVVIKAVLDASGAELYSVKYNSGFITGNDTLVGVKWRFAASSSKHVRKPRVKRGWGKQPVVTTGRERKAVDTFKAESATANNQSILGKRLSLPASAKKQREQKVARIDFNPEEDVEVFLVEVETDSEGEYEGEILDSSCVTVAD